MNSGRPWRLAIALAWRETRGGLRGFRIYLACLALGVAAIAGVGDFSASMESALKGDARRLLGGDVEIRRAYKPLPPDMAAYAAQKGRLSESVRMRAMVTGSGGAAALSELKAVDRAYPLYGAVELEPPMPLGRALGNPNGQWGAVAGRDLLHRLSLKVGDEIKLGRARFRIRAALIREPDRATENFSLGPRLMISLPGLAEAGLDRPGAMFFHLYKLALKPGGDAALAAEEMKKRMQGLGVRVRDYAAAVSRLAAVINNTAPFLVLVSLAALLVGGMGVGDSVRNYLEGKKNTMAALKCLGAERSLIFRAYLCQSLGVALLGGLLGCGLGLAASKALTAWLADWLGLTMEWAWQPGPLLLALGCGLLTALAFSLRPLSAAGAVSPARLFRGYAEPDPPKGSRRALAGAGAALACLMAVASLATNRPMLTMAFAAGVLAAAAVFWAYWRWVRWAAGKVRRLRGPRIEQALRNLRRPGAEGGQVIMSLGLGLTALIAVSLVDANLQHQITERIPQRAPAFFALGVTKAESRGFVSLMEQAPGVVRVDSEASIRGMITRVNGAPAEKVKPSRQAAWALRGERGMSFAAEKPAKAALAQGQWWPADYQGPPIISLDSRIAEGLGLAIGDTLTVNILGREITARIHNLRKIDWASLALNHSIIFAPGVLEKAPYSFIAAIYAPARAEAAILRRASERYPRVVLVGTREVLGEVTRVLSRIGMGLRAIALFTLIAGVLVLVQAFKGNLERRRFETVVFKVFGATRKDILLTQALEFSLLGLSAAVLACGLGAVASYIFVSQTLTAITWRFLAWPAVMASGGGVLITLALGLWGVRGVLKQKAAPILRNE